MSISKIYLSEQLIEGYVKTPPSLEEQAFTKLAILLCETYQLKRDILCASDTLTVEISRENDECYNTWENLIETRSKAICEAISFPPALRSELIFRIRLIALELFSWNKQHQAIFHTSAYATDQFLIPSDWTIEGRLDEAKIAERLVQDERITVSRRYRLACIYSLEQYIIPLWNRATKRQQECFCGMKNLGYNKQSELVRIKSYHLAGKLHEIHLFENDAELCEFQLKRATEEGTRTAFLNFWSNLSEDRRRNVIMPLASDALVRSERSPQGDWMATVMQNRYYRFFSRPGHYSDIFYFLLSQMSENQRLSVFRVKILQQNMYSLFQSKEYDRVLLCSIRWPYRDFFIPIITKMWSALPKDIYAAQLLALACKYSEHAESKQEKQDFASGVLLVELLEQTPAHFKHYIFSTVIPDLENTWGLKILYIFFQKQPGHEQVHKYQNLFKRFSQHVPPEAMQPLFLLCEEIRAKRLSKQ